MHGSCICESMMRNMKCSFRKKKGRERERERETEGRRFLPENE